MSNEEQINNNNKKKKKRSELIAIEIEEKAAHFDKMIEEHKKILELTQREYTNTVKSAEIKMIKSRKEIILEAGRYLENNLDIVKNQSPDQICRMLKQKFKGIINPSTIWSYSPDKWKSAGRANAGRKGAFAANANRLFVATDTIATKEEEEPLTEYEQQYVKVHESKMEYKDQIEKLIDHYLNLTKEEKVHIISKTPTGSDYQKALIEKARDNLLKLAKRLNDTDIGEILSNMRFIDKIHATYSTIIYEELQLRKRNKEISGQ